MTYNPEVRSDTSLDLIKQRIIQLETKRQSEVLTMYENLELQDLLAKLY